MVSDNNAISRLLQASFICDASDKLVTLFDEVNNSNSFIVDEPCPYGDGYAAKKSVEVLLGSA